MAPGKANLKLKQAGVNLGLRTVAQLKSLALNSSEGDSNHLIGSKAGLLHIKITRKKDAVKIRQHPFTHGLAGGLEVLESVLKKGFTGWRFPNATPALERKTPSPWASRRLPVGDSYSIELLTPSKETGGIQGAVFPPTARFIGFAPKKHVLRVVISLNPRLASEGRENRKQFYLLILRKHGIPVSFT